MCKCIISERRNNMANVLQVLENAYQQWMELVNPELSLTSRKTVLRYVGGNNCMHNFSQMCLYNKWVQFLSKSCCRLFRNIKVNLHQSCMQAESLVKENTLKHGISFKTCNSLLIVIASCYHLLSQTHRLMTSHTSEYCCKYA